MPIRYAGDAYNRAVGTRSAFAGLSADLEREGLPAMVVNDGDREEQDEIDVFLARFRPQASGVGSFNDVRWWRGVRYVRFSPLGTVAPPGTGNHGKRRANDLGYPYNSDTPAHRRAQVLAKRHNITCEGMGFREWWHWTFWGPLGAIASAAGGGNTTRPEDIMNAEQEKKLDAVLQALGAGGLQPGQWDDTIMGNTRDIEAQVNGLPDALKAIMAQVNGIPEVLADIRKRIGVSEAQVEVIADAVAKQIGTPMVKLDYAAIAKAVNDDAARRLMS
ncbi:hypothetical protein [Microbacterium maritypicum]|uniref:Peptidase M15B domain-containing protein n=1 Tax=Microbacterium maritypicum MF109 TaxID=1333857 RepID=T5KWP5_MICMQ|nr:hypothetical protein [Microbacterium liquefaciens]EQM83431.1 hypothetical protein L687_12490 [Microbacterium maritypicum MF109]